MSGPGQGSPAVSPYYRLVGGDRVALSNGCTIFLLAEAALPPQVLLVLWRRVPQQVLGEGPGHGEGEGASPPPPVL